MRRIWKSGDRFTAWEKRLELRHPDGTLETFTVEEVRLLHPRTQQVMTVDGFIRIVPADRQIYDRKTGERVHRTVYWDFCQSFYGGPGAKGDALGGYATGRMYTYTSRQKFDEAMKSLARQGFTEKVA